MTSGRSATPRAMTILMDVVIIAASVALALVVAEGLLRLKNASMTNYDIEIWRYARELTRPSDDPRTGHEHVPNGAAVLQAVSIRTNQWGLRGGPIARAPSPGTRRILVLGDSQVLGWGVAEEDTLSAALQNGFEQRGLKAEVLNGGVGGYNAARCVELYLNRLAELEPADILLVLNPTSVMEPGNRAKGNVLVQHSQLAAMAWVYLHQLTRGDESGAAVVSRFERLYAPDAVGWQGMVAELEKMAVHARAHAIRVTLVMLPDFRYIADYGLQFAHEAVSGLSRRLGFACLDLLPLFSSRPFGPLRTMPGDFHFNAKAHAMIADAVFPILVESPPMSSH